MIKKAKNQKTVQDKKAELRGDAVRFVISATIALILTVILSVIYTEASPAVSVNIGSGSTTDGALGTLEVFFLILMLGLLPTMIIMTTSFTRIIIVFSFLRNAMGTQNAPPNQILIGLALFLTLFIMRPVVNEINVNAYQPYSQELITRDEAIDSAIVPVKRFMLKQVNKSDLSLFMTLAKETLPENFEEAGPESLLDLSLTVVTPAFITSEIKRAFTIGFLIYVPFLIIDMIVSSTLMSMGMVMLPPAMISLPFKIMLFVTVDGWGMLISSLVKGFGIT